MSLLAALVLAGVGADMELTKPEVRVYIDRNKAGDLGVDVKTIASAISTLIGGREVSQYRVGGNSYDVRVRLVPEQRSMFQDITVSWCGTARESCCA